MAMDMFLKLEGGPNIKGESIDSKHKDTTEVLAWSWGMSQSGTMHSSTGGGAGKVNVQDMSLTTYLESSTAPLMLACCAGTHFDAATLTVRKAGDKPLEYLVIKMKEVIVSSITTGGSGGEDKLTQNVTLNFAEFNVVYQKQKKDGGGEKGGEMTWNIPENTKK